MHTAKTVKQYFANKKIHVLEQLAKSSDLNIVRYCWERINLKIILNINEFRKYIAERLKELRKKIIKELYKSLLQRMVVVIKCKADRIKYQTIIKLVSFVPVYCLSRNFLSF